MKQLKQTPATGSRLIVSRGDTVEFRLLLPSEQEGTGWVRTNMGNSSVRMREIALHAEAGKPIQYRDWHDLPMRQADGRHHILSLPALDVGRFEAKTFFLPAGSDEPRWPEGDNVILKVEPADYFCCNSIYTAFVRQFVPADRVADEEERRSVGLLDGKGYTVIPPSGTFRELTRRLDTIIGKLRFRIIQLLPIFPVPTTYARMGRFGSPFASMDFLAVDPALAEFDRRTTPRDQFRELVYAVHARSAKLWLDIPVNHTGWASRLQIERPEWFARRPDKTFESPGAWGTTWEDLSRLDYSNRDLWRYMADVFLFWCREGVDGFRCDAGYQVPAAAWEYMVAKVREQYPDTIFLLEGLGGDPRLMEQLLDGSNLDWAYSELFQNYDRAQVESYLGHSEAVSRHRGLLVHFAETHDNNRLAARGPAYARMRTLLAALCSPQGAFGITSGVEWFADAKIDVHGADPLKWGCEPNMLDLLARLNAILETHPAFHAGSGLKVIHHREGSGIAVLRTTVSGTQPLLVLVNLDDSHPCRVSWPLSEFADDGNDVHDLVTGARLEISKAGGMGERALGPAEAMCLTRNAGDLATIQGALLRPVSSPTATRDQRLRAKAVEIRCMVQGVGGMAGPIPDIEAQELAVDPDAFCRSVLKRDVSCITTWEWPRDLKRIVMLSPGRLLLVKADRPFTAALRFGGRLLHREASIEIGEGAHSALLAPVAAPKEPRACEIELTLFGGLDGQPAHSTVLLLPDADRPLVRSSFTVNEVADLGCYAICTDRHGGMAQVHGEWGRIRSQYDALLAASLNADYPSERRVMFTRCRAWIVCQGYSHPLGPECLERFGLAPEGEAMWEFDVPAGGGRSVQLAVTLCIPPAGGRALLRFTRLSAGAPTAADTLDDATPVKLILRPDVEDRLNHEKTKAYSGPEAAWPAAVANEADAFTFTPHPERRLTARLRASQFTPQPEWTYKVEHPVDADRGMDGAADLFSPGFFTIALLGGGAAVLEADISNPAAQSPAVADQAQPEAAAVKPPRFAAPMRLDEAMKNAMRRFIVDRGSGKSVIAGYPWFLDWGRDTLICARGVAAAGFLDEVDGILRETASHESEGSLPNMIRGADASNRDTSDAPLWLFVACRDLMRARGNREVLDADCGGRRLRDVLLSIAASYLKGTANGISVDPRSALVFSPAHFTWMDTNYPACSPRQGYPIEIQGLWHAALSCLAEWDGDRKWAELAERVRESVVRFFPLRAGGAAERRTAHGTGNYLSDCLHAAPGQPAAEAFQDDALRPNQLLALTLGCVTEKNLCHAVLCACEELLVPGAIRSLADRPVRHALAVRHDGRLLNDPLRPYSGVYSGDEDTRRKPAYHNGTAWTWLFPSYAEAMLGCCGEGARKPARSLLASSAELINRGCVGQVPEIVDGDAPHVSRGCGAQAWGVTELYRVVALLGTR